MSPSIESRGGAPSVTLLVRHNHTMTVDCADTSELLAAVERKISVPREATWLCFAGRKLEAGKPLAHYGLCAGSTVHVATRGRGGGCGNSKGTVQPGGASTSGGPGTPQGKQAQGVGAPSGENLTRYTEPASIWRALETGHVRLLKASYLIKLADVNGILDRRQELPLEAFISVEELKRLFGEGNRDGVLHGTSTRRPADLSSGGSSRPIGDGADQHTG